MYAYRIVCQHLVWSPSMATVLDLSNGNTYLARLFVWCMSGAPHVFDGKWAPVMSLFMWRAMCG